MDALADDVRQIIETHVSTLFKGSASQKLAPRVGVPDPITSGWANFGTPRAERVWVSVFPDGVGRYYGKEVELGGSGVVVVGHHAHLVHGVRFDAHTLNYNIKHITSNKFVEKKKKKKKKK